MLAQRARLLGASRGITQGSAAAPLLRHGPRVRQVVSTLQGQRDTRASAFNLNRGPPLPERILASVSLVWPGKRGG